MKYTCTCIDLSKLFTNKADVHVATKSLLPVCSGHNVPGDTGGYAEKRDSSLVRSNWWMQERPLWVLWAYVCVCGRDVPLSTYHTGRYAL